MTDQPPAEPPRGPILFDAGTDAVAAARLAEAAASLLADRPVAVLAVWEPPPVMSGYDAALDALYDFHGELREAARSAAADAASAAGEVLDAHGVAVTRRVVPDERGSCRSTVRRFQSRCQPPGPDLVSVWPVAVLKRRRQPSPIHIGYVTTGCVTIVASSCPNRSTASQSV